MRGQGVLISALVFALIIAIFAVINVKPVEVNFLFTKTTLPLILIILASTLLGGLTVWLLGMIRQIRLQRTVKSLEKQVSEMTEEAERLGISKGAIHTGPKETAAIPQAE